MRFCADAGHAGSRRLQAAAASPPHVTARLLRLSGPSHRTLMASARLLLEATSSHESSLTEAIPERRDDVYRVGCARGSARVDRARPDTTSRGTRPRHLHTIDGVTSGQSCLAKTQRVILLLYFMAQAWRSIVLPVIVRQLPPGASFRTRERRKRLVRPPGACSRARCSARPRALTGAHESSRSGAPRVHWSSTRHFRPHA